MCEPSLTVELDHLFVAVDAQIQNDNRCARQSVEALETGGEIQFKSVLQRFAEMHFNTRCKRKPTKSAQRHSRYETHADSSWSGVGWGGRVRKGGIYIGGSYPSLCSSAADPFAALVRELAATSTGSMRLQSAGGL